MTNEPPKPGQCCQTCGLVVPSKSIRLIVGKNHPETSRAAVRAANLSVSARGVIACGILADRGPLGATDDEIDALTGWGHQCTTPIMNRLRKTRMVAWAFDESGKSVKRDTRKGNPARVNVLDEYAVNAAAIVRVNT